MRDYEFIKIDNDEKVKFTELYHYNGPKLEVCDSKNAILVWNDDENGKEKWIYIKCSESIYNKYISTEISLLNTIKQSEAYLAERTFSNYEEIKVSEKIEDISNVEYHPEEDSFLSFNYYAETLAPYVNFEKKNFKFENKKVTMSSERTESAYIEKYEKKNVYTLSVKPNFLITSPRKKYAAA